MFYVSCFMSLGEQLKKIREDAGLSIMDLAVATKIQFKYLKRLESEEYDKLPIPVYVRGFIQKWTRACGVDSEKLLLQFYRENKPLINKIEDNQLPSIKAPSFIITSRHLIIVLTTFSLVVLGGYFVYNQRIFQNTPKIEIFSPKEFNVVTENDTILISGKASKVDSILINQEEIESQQGKFEHNYLLSPGLNTIIIKVKSGTGKTAETIRKVFKL